jgi:superfamily II helicase
MPGNVETAELRKALSDPERVRASGFEILQELCRLTSASDEQDVQDMVLRALEMREHFVLGQEILDGLVRHFGLFQYLEPADLPWPDQIAYEVHRPANLEDEIVFHRPQAEVYWTLLAGENVILSAPTSFGKSLIIDAVIASGRYRNILIVVPTVALIDETRRRLSRRFRNSYKIITHGSQTREERNIFVATQERVLKEDVDDDIDLFVIDEFYKLSPARGEDDRSALLNQVVYRLVKKVRQFYMLGPNVLGISSDFGRRVKYRTFLEPYRTVVSELHNVGGEGNEFDRLISLCKTLDDSTLIFCRSPDRATRVAKYLVEAGLGQESPECREAAEWVASHYHPEWHFAKALHHGIGVHHGRIPRALGQYAVRAFNNDEIKILVCTSTLIEGVNTKAKNIVIFDNEINRAPIDLFTFNNIRGRAGRMLQHFVGHVYLFHPEPEQELPLVDMPIFTQSEDAPESLLMQIDEDELTIGSRNRLQPFFSQEIVDYATLKSNVGIDPQRQLNMAREIRDKLLAKHI